MSEQQHVGSITPSAASLAETADSSDPASVREVFRAKNRLAVSVMERTQQYRVAYSLSDIHRLTFLSHDERATVEGEWRAWHRKYVRLGATGVALWLAGVVVAWALWFRAEAVAGTFAGWGLTTPSMWITGVAVVATLALFVSLPALLATVSAASLCDSYLRGYMDGLTRGVNRALHITPEIEAEMWEELRQAERLDASWRRVGGDPNPLNGTPNGTPNGTSNGNP